MSLHLWLIFAGAVFLLCGTPGPNMLHVLARSVEIGMRRSVAAMIGCLLALLMMLLAAATGLTTLLRAHPVAFDVLRYAGACYLFYLGIKAWRSRPAVAAEEVPAVEATRLHPAALCRGGFMTGISNPKTMLFVTAFLPQFLDRHWPQGPQFVVMIATFLAIEGGWYLIYATGGRSLAHYLSRPATKKVFNRVTGGLFVGFGATLLAGG